MHPSPRHKRYLRRMTAGRHQGLAAAQTAMSAGTVVCLVGAGLWLAGCGCQQSADPRSTVSKSASAVATSQTSAEESPPSTTSLPLDPAEEPPGASSHPALSEVAQPVYRPDDQRPVHDEAHLAALNIRKYESRRLRLYTDIPEADAQSLPMLADHAVEALFAYFGPLPPARDGSDFQMTGYLFRSEALFREAGLIPVDLPTFEHGRHRRNEFWMRDQTYDYYRRHLLIHEITHCVMTYLPETRAPVWYLEGMAELFGTHRLNSDGQFAWGVMPDAPENFAGLGRITLIRDEYARGRDRSIPQILQYQAEEFLEPAPYAWSWALCHFLARHPRYREKFQALGQHLTGDQFLRVFQELFATEERDLTTEWTLFTLNLQYGYDLERAAIEFRTGTPLAAHEAPREVVVQADRGWQSSGLFVEAGATYHLKASGRFTLADVPKPWVSEPQGVSIRYFDGFPLGQLLACLRQENEPTASGRETMTNVLPIGRERQFTAPVSGTLYLRLNDSWSELADNRGQVLVTLQRVE